MHNWKNGRWSLSEKMSSTNSKKITAFRREVWSHYKRHGRYDLPWRKTNDPYKVLVSEIMLQQTQVPRVIGKYKSFVKQFPTIQKLAKASFSEVLKAWNGLGYNRRAKYLHETAKKLSTKRQLTAADFDGLPGVGPYSRSAIRVFAFNKPDILIETNIRTAVLHHFYSSILQNTRISDKELMTCLRDAAKRQEPREWHWALMDYGAHLKRSGVHNNHRSAHYAKQSKFEGSLRQVRGAILRELSVGSMTEAAVRRRLYTKKRWRDWRRMG